MIALGGKKIILGLTGKTGAGKSTVAAALAARGAAVHDADKLVRELEQNDSGVICALCNAFGSDIYTDGALNRQLLAARAFASQQSIQLINGIVHPAVTKRLTQLITEAFDQGFNVCVVDAAALIESGFCSECDLLAVVTAPLDIRKSRIIGRDSLTPEQAQIRINAQKSDDYYESRADYIIRNYPPYELDSELAPLLGALGLQ